MTPKERAEQIFAYCFTKEELEFLKQQPEFIAVSRKIDNLVDTSKAVDTGERLIHEHGTAKGTRIQS